MAPETRVLSGLFIARGRRHCYGDIAQLTSLELNKGTNRQDWECISRLEHLMCSIWVQPSTTDKRPKEAKV